MSRARTVAISLASVALAMEMTVAGCGLSSPSKDWAVPNDSSYGISEEKMLIEGKIKPMPLSKMVQDHPNINEPFTSNKVDDISFSKVMHIKDAKLPNEVTPGQIKKLVK